MLCAFWALLGTFGHDPWKTEDATAFGIAYEMIERGDVLVPRLAGEPFVDRPPLVYAAAAAAAFAFSPMLPMPDAARLAAAVVLGLTMLLLAATAMELYGREFRWMAVLLFIGSVGLWDRAHQLSPEQGLMLGITAALYGFALALRRPMSGGLVLGLGLAVAFLSRGFLGPLWLAVTAIVLPAAFPNVADAARYALTRHGRARDRPAPWRCLAARRSSARAPEHLHAWWSMQSVVGLLRAARRLRVGRPAFLLSRTFRGSPGRRCRWCCGRSGRAAADSTAASRPPVCSFRARSRS